jgi:hypothetical protein
MLILRLLDAFLRRRNCEFLMAPGGLDNESE